MVVTVLPTDNRLTAKQLAAVPLLARGDTLCNVAKHIKCNAKTVARWRQQPIFSQALKQCEQELYDEALNTLRKTVPSAIACLVRHMNSEDTPAYTQVSAASKLLDVAIEVGKMAEIEQNYDELRQVLKARGIS